MNMHPLFIMQSPEGLWRKGKAGSELSVNKVVERKYQESFHFDFRIDLWEIPPKNEKKSLSKAA